jgi:hypothetical protein
MKTKKFPYFLNKHNKNNMEITSLLGEGSLPKSNRKVRKESIYSLLALSPKFERKQGQERVVKKNTGFQNVKRLLSKTEDEKHELDIRIIQFETVIKMLGELKIILEEEQNGKVEGEGKEKESVEKEKKIVEEEERGTQGKEGDVDTPQEGGGESKKIEIEDQDQNVDQNVQENKDSDKIPEEQNYTNIIKLSNIQPVLNSKQEETKPTKMKVQSKMIYEKYFKRRVDKHKNEVDKKMEKREEPVSRKEYLVTKIRKLKIIDLIYDSNKRRKIKISEILFKNLHSKIVNRLQERVKEKLENLVQIRSFFSENNWKQNLINNYYKSLDVRSGCLQQSERTYLSPKYFISNLLETEKRIKEEITKRYWKQVFHPEICLAIEQVSESENHSADKCLKLGQRKDFNSDKMYDSFIKIEEEESEKSDKGAIDKNENMNTSMVLLENKNCQGNIRVF